MSFNLLYRRLWLLILMMLTAISSPAGVRAQAILYLNENFNSYAPGQKPINWLEQDNNLSAGDFFQTITWNTHKTYGTSLVGVDPYYTHFNGPSALTWQNYEVRGRLYHSHTNGDVGVTFYSQYPGGQDRYYRLGHYSAQPGFELIAHGAAISGTTSIAVTTQANSWYRFKIRVETLVSRVNIKARIWLEGESEPGSWQIDAYDDSAGRIVAGTVGLWTANAGFKAIDDVMVYSLAYSPPPMPAPIAPPSFPKPSLSKWPIGLFDVALTAHSNLHNTDFDTVHQFNSTQTITQAITYLDSAQAANLQVIQNMPEDSFYKSDEFWINWVQSLDSHTALLWWYLPEEPTDYGAIKRLYGIVRQYDNQQHPVVTYFPNPDLNIWCNTFDAVLIGSFPEYWHVPRANMMARVDLAQTACPNVPVIATPMFFDSNFDGSGDYPSSAEARFDAFTAIIAGARGLHWYSYYRGVGLTDLWAALQTLSSNIASLHGVLTSPPVLQSIQVQILSGPLQSPQTEGLVYDSIQIWQAKYSGDIYIFASNLATETVKARFTGLTERTEPVEVLFESRSINVVNETFEDIFGANRIHIYYLPNFDPAPFSGIYLPLILRSTPN